MSKAKYRIPIFEDNNATPQAKKKPKLGRLIGVFFGIMFLIMVGFLYTMTGDYVFNDSTHFTALKNAQDFGEFWLNLFSTALSQPLSLQWLKATYAWDLQSFGLSPGWSHAVNICLHLVTCLYFYVLVFRISWRLHMEQRTKLDPYYVAAAATALLACHPLVTGSVGYISGRIGVLGAANYFLALNCFLFGFFEEKLDKAFTGYALFFLFLVIGMMSNIQCWSLPFVAIVIALVLKPVNEKWKEYLLERSWEIGLFAGVGVAMVWLLTFPIYHRVDNGFGLATVSAPIYIATQFRLIVIYYLRCFFYPFGLTISPPHALSQGWSDLGTISGIAVAIILPLAGFFSKRPVLQIAAAIFVCSLFPWLVRVQPELVADYRFYLPLTALALACGLPVAYLAGLDFRKTAIGFAVLVAVLTGLTIYRNVQWSTDKQLWRAEVRLNDQDSRTRALRGRFLRTQGKPEEAMKEVQQALKLNQQDLIANAELGELQYDQRDFYQGSLTYKKVIDVGKALGLPEDELAPLYVSLTHCYMEMGQLDNAAKSADVAFQYIKGDAFLYFVLGKRLLKDHKALIALDMFEKGYKRDPTDPEFMEAIAEASLETRLTQTLPQAYTLARKAMRIRRSTEATKLFIRAALEMGKVDEVVTPLDLLKQSGKVDTDPELSYLWSVYHRMKGATKLADQEKDYAVSRDPDVVKRFHLKLAIKPGEKMPAPEIMPGASSQHPDISKVDPNIPNILAPKKKSDSAPAPVHAPPAVNEPAATRQPQPPSAPNVVSPAKTK